MRKKGWDCLRHYEIIASGSVPFFEDYESIPKFTMFNYPKTLQKKANDLYLKTLKNDKMPQDDLENYVNCQKEFEKSLRENALNFGSKDLKDQISNTIYNNPNNKVGIFPLIKINFFSNYEYRKERNNSSHYFLKLAIFLKSILSLIKNYRKKSKFKS